MEFLCQTQTGISESTIKLTTIKLGTGGLRRREDGSALCRELAKVFGNFVRCYSNLNGRATMVALARIFRFDHKLCDNRTALEKFDLSRSHNRQQLATIIALPPFSRRYPLLKSNPVEPSDRISDLNSTEQFRFEMFWTDVASLWSADRSTPKLGRLPLPWLDVQRQIL